MRSMRLRSRYMRPVPTHLGLQLHLGGVLRWQKAFEQTPLRFAQVAATRSSSLQEAFLNQSLSHASAGVMTNAEPSTREHILRTGLALISQSGLSAVTLGVLADQVGMSQSGLFAHLRSKAAVQIELLNHMSGFAADRVFRPSLTASKELPRLRALVRNWFGWAQRAGLPGGCPVAAGLFEFDDVEGVVQQDPRDGSIDPRDDD